MFHYCGYRNLLLDHILNQVNIVHPHTTSFTEIHLRIVFPRMVSWLTDFLAGFLPTCCICPTMHANCPMHLILLDMIIVIIYSELYKLLSYLLCSKCMNVQYIQSWSTCWLSKKFQILAALQTEEKACYYKVFGYNIYVTFNMQFALIIFSTILTIFIYMWGDTTHTHICVIQHLWLTSFRTCCVCHKYCSFLNMAAACGRNM